MRHPVSTSPATSGRSVGTAAGSSGGVSAILSSRAAILALTGGLVLTGLGVRMATDVVRDEGDAELVRAAEGVHAAVQRQLSIYEEMLLGFRNFYAATGPVTRDEFNEYATGGGSATQLPGVQALEFTRKVAAEDVEAFEATVRADKSLNGVGYPDFSVFPDTGEKHRFVVEFVVPMQGNEQAFGFDLASTAMRRVALEAARDSGEPVATGPIELAQLGGNATGILVLVPVYDSELPQATISQRQAALLGFVNSVIRVDAMLDGILGGDSIVELEIYDLGATTQRLTAEPSAANLLFNSDRELKFSGRDAMPDGPGVIEMAVAGRRWLMVATAPRHLSLTGARGADPRGSLPWSIGLGGLALSFAMATALGATARSKRMAELVSEQMKHEATHDPLTGVLNRRVFTDSVDHALARTARHGGMVAVLFMDLDRFKAINDTAGHDVGDQVLVAVAEGVGAVLRGSATLSRLGGDEFIVLADDLGDVDGALRLSERISAAVREVRLSGASHRLSVSIGVACARDGDESAEVLIRNADAAMYEAKAAGRDCIEVIDRPLRRRLIRHSDTEAQLSEAVDRRQLSVEYQAIIDAASGGICGSEALVRWHHPQRGMVSPSEFIPLAEEIGLIGKIDSWVLQTACEQVVRWDEQLGIELDMNVNLSARELVEIDLPGRVERVLVSQGIDPNRLCLEITETALIHEPTRAETNLGQLRELGIRLALDDYGTGYSSLTHLQTMPLTDIKIDRAFISGLGTSPRDTAIVLSTIRLAHSLSLKVTAEGVETAAQLSLLRTFGCDRVQGFHLARPQPPSQFEQMLQPRIWELEDYAT